MDYRLLTARSSNIPRRDGSPLLRVDKTGPELRSSPRLALIREAAASRVQALAVTRVPAGLAPPLGARLSPSILVGIPAGATSRVVQAPSRLSSLGASASLDRSLPRRAPSFIDSAVSYVVSQPRAADRVPSPAGSQAFASAASLPSEPVFVVRPSKARVRFADKGDGREGGQVVRMPSKAVRPVPFAAAASHIPVGDPRYQLLSAAFARSRKGVRLSAEEKAAQRSHDDVQRYKQGNAADWLLAVVPRALRDYMLGGDLAVAQNPVVEERDAALRSQFLLKAGSDGSALGKVRRFLELLDEMAPGAAMPAGRLLVHRTIMRGSIDALSAASGSQGGQSVAASLRTGSRTAADVGFPVEADSLLVDAAAPPQKKRRRERRSGSAPIKWYCHMEYQCVALPAGPGRLVCRQQTLAAFHARLRQVDVVRSVVLHGGYAADGCVIVMIVTSFSKDGSPIDVYFRAEGFLGRFEWIEEHLREVAPFESYAIPAFKCPSGHAGDVLWALRVEDRTASKEHSIKSLKALTALAPLFATAEVWESLGVTPHFSHGTPSDMAAVIGEHAPEDVAMTDVDERELGHWRRLAVAAGLQGGDLVLDDVVKEALDYSKKIAADKAAGRTPTAAQPAMRAEDAAMRVRYTSGTNREGRKRAQVRVHLRWVTAVRRALSAFGSWEDLAGDRSDYDILERIPELPVAATASDASGSVA